MSQVLTRSAEDIENSLWERITISLPLLYSLKDIVWYNLEHLPNEGERKGRSTLKWMGSSFPHFIFQDNLHVKKDKVELFLSDLEKIRGKWSNEFYYVSISSKTDNWSGGSENPSAVIIYDQAQEKPSKYGYNPYNMYSSGITDKDGKILSSQMEIVLCSVESKLGTYGKEPLIRSLLENMIECCKRAIKFEKGVYLDINSYDYTL